MHWTSEGLRDQVLNNLSNYRKVHEMKLLPQKVSVEPPKPFDEQHDPPNQAPSGVAGYSHQSRYFGSCIELGRSLDWGLKLHKFLMLMPYRSQLEIRGSFYDARLDT